MVLLNISACFASSGTDCLCFVLSLSKGCLYSKQPRKIYIVSLSGAKGQVCLLFSVIEIISLS